MKKTYWWRVLLLGIGGAVALMGWIYDSKICFVGNGDCPLDNFRLSVFEPFVLISLSLLAISPFLFFIRDGAFLKWLKFAIGWIVLSAVLIILSPEYSAGIPGGPTKERVSIWMGVLLFIFSLGYIFHSSWQLRKNK